MLLTTWFGNIGAERFCIVSEFPPYDTICISRLSIETETHSQPSSQTQGTHHRHTEALLKLPLNINN